MFEVIENPTLVRVSDGIIEVQAYCLLISRQGFFITVEALHGITFMEIDRCILRVQAYCLLIGFQRLLIVAQIPENLTLVKVGNAIAGVEGNGLLIGCQGLLIMYEASENFTLIWIGRDKIRIQAHGLLISRQRLLVAHTGTQCIAFAEKGHHATRLRYLRALPLLRYVMALLGSRCIACSQAANASSYRPRPSSVASSFSHCFERIIPFTLAHCAPPLTPGTRAVTTGRNTMTYTILT